MLVKMLQIIEVFKLDEATIRVGNILVFSFLRDKGKGLSSAKLSRQRDYVHSTFLIQLILHINIPMSFLSQNVITVIKFNSAAEYPRSLRINISNKG